MTYTVVRVPEITKTFRLPQSYLHKYGGVALKVFCMLIFLNYGHSYIYYSSSHQIAFVEVGAFTQVLNLDE